jgi:hypothetical protein
MSGIMMGSQPESQRAFLMDQDPLQWLWDGVKDFQTKFNDLRKRASRSFRLLVDPAAHDDDCRLKNSQTRMPCSCCKGALTFDEARFVKEKLTDGRAEPNTKPRKFEGVPATTCWGIENYRELFGLRSDKDALSAAFEAGTDNNKRYFLFGSSGIVSRTLDHWRDLLEDAFKPGCNRLIREGRSRAHGLFHFQYPSKKQYPFCFFGGALRAQREGIDRPQAVWAACSNGILSICLCAEWPASTSHGPQRGACGGAGCTVRPAALRQAGQRLEVPRLTKNIDYLPKHRKRKNFYFFVPTSVFCEIEGLMRMACCLRRTCLLRIAGRDACHARRIQHCTLDVVLANQT